MPNSREGHPKGIFGNGFRESYAWGGGLSVQKSFALKTGVELKRVKPQVSVRGQNEWKSENEAVSPAIRMHGSTVKPVSSCGRSAGRHMKPSSIGTVPGWSECPAQITPRSLRICGVSSLLAPGGDRKRDIETRKTGAIPPFAPRSKSEGGFRVLALLRRSIPLARLEFFDCLISKIIKRLRRPGAYFS